MIVLACIGLLALQVRLLQNTADLRRATFEQNAKAALAASVQALEERNVVDRIFYVSDMSAHGPVRVRRTVSAVPAEVAPSPAGHKDSAIAVSVIVTPSGTLRTWVKEGRLVGSSDRPQAVTVEALDVLGRLDTTLIREEWKSGEFSLPLPSPGEGRRMAYLRVRTDKGVATMKVGPEGGANAFSFTYGDSVQRERMVRRVVESFTVPSMPLISRGLSASTLDSLVRSALTQHGIDQPFAAAVVANDTVVVASDRTGAWTQQEGTFVLPVGPAGPFTSSERLIVRFPSWRSRLWAGLWPEISVTVALFAVIVGIFTATLRTIRRQKEFAGRLSDFIGNMTHEFKTPLATISLASEALTRTDVKRSARKIDTYNGVIRDENKRMGAQVERILQMASLEEGELDLRREPLDLQALVEDAVRKARMTVEHRGGTIELMTRASESTVAGDRVHLENVLHNLLDNAIKYSPDGPRIMVTTTATEGSLRIAVRDRGPGIAHDQQARVFEKYYRVPTGNLHEVKGFGLGLSYVKLVVTSLGGSVALASEPGAGTEISVQLPLIPATAARHGRSQ